MILIDVRPPRLGMSDKHGLRKLFEHLVDTFEPHVVCAVLQMHQDRNIKLCGQFIKKLALFGVAFNAEFLLADDDSEAGDLFADEGDLLYAAMPQHYRAIDDAIKGFDFERALEKLKAAAVAAGIEVDA